MLCAARTSDDENPERASSGTQFYIVTGKFYTEMELDKMEEKIIKPLLLNNGKPICLKGALPTWTGYTPSSAK